MMSRILAAKRSKCFAISVIRVFLLVSSFFLGACNSSKVNSFSGTIIIHGYLKNPGYYKITGESISIHDVVRKAGGVWGSGTFVAIISGDNQELYFKEDQWGNIFLTQEFCFNDEDVIDISIVCRNYGEE